MATPFLRKDGRYQQKVYIGMKDGKKQFKTVTGTLDEVKYKVRNMEYEVQHMIYVEPQKTPINEMLDEWLKVYPTLKDLDITTTKLYQGYIDKVLKPYFEGMMIGFVKPMHIETFYVKMLKKGCTPNTLQKYHAVLSQFFKYAHKNEMIKANPMEKIDRPTVKNKFKPAIITTESFEKLLDITQGTVMYYIILVAAYTGLRRSELFGLRWKDIDFKSKCIHVQRALVRVGNDFITKDRLKTDSSKRVLSVGDTVLSVLEEYKASKKIISADRGIFEGEMNPSNCSKRFNYWVKKAGVTGIRFHDLRHYNASVMLKAGISDKVAAGRLGHAQVATTRQIYQHVFEEVDRNAANVLERSMVVQKGGAKAK